MEFYFDYTFWSPITSEEYAGFDEEMLADCEYWDYNGETYYCTPVFRHGESAPIAENTGDIVIIINEMWVPAQMMVLQRIRDREFRIAEVDGQWWVNFSVGDVFTYIGG